jgi:predicted dehydrogenase
MMAEASTRIAHGSVLGANDRINLGVIGPGGQGQSLIRTFARQSNTTVVAVCDIFEPNLNKGLTLAGGDPKPSNDYRKLIELKEVDAVVIATPLHHHLETALAALSAGKHVYLEKTMAYSVEQCDQIVKAAKARPSQVLQIGFQRHYNPVVRKVVDLCRSGGLGTITHIHCTWHRNANWRRPVPKVDFDPRPWGYPSLEHLVNWRMYKKYSGGLMAELGSHMMEVVSLIYGVMPTAVTGFGGIDYWKDGRETYDNVSVIYTFPGGQKATFSSITTNAHHGEHISIMGTEATIEMGWNEASYYREKEGAEAVKLEGPAVITSTGETMPATKSGAGTQLQGPQPERVDSLALAVQSFLTCVREGKKPEADALVGRNAAMCIHLANQAMEQGRVIKF